MKFLRDLLHPQPEPELPYDIDYTNQGRRSDCLKLFVDQSGGEGNAALVGGAMLVYHRKAGNMNESEGTMARGTEALLGKTSAKGDDFTIVLEPSGNIGELVRALNTIPAARGEVVETYRHSCDEAPASRRERMKERGKVEYERHRASDMTAPYIYDRLDNRLDGRTILEELQKQGFLTPDTVQALRRGINMLEGSEAGKLPVDDLKRNLNLTFRLPESQGREDAGPRL